MPAARARDMARDGHCSELCNDFHGNMINELHSVYSSENRRSIWMSTVGDGYRAIRWKSRFTLQTPNIRRTVHIKWLSFPQISATPSSLTTRHVLRHPLHFQDPNSSHSKSLGAWDLLWKLNCFQPLSAVSYRHDQDPIRDLTVFLLWRLWIGGSFAQRS